MHILQELVPLKPLKKKKKNQSGSQTDKIMHILWVTQGVKTRKPHKVVLYIDMMEYLHLCHPFLKRHGLTLR